jgi:hypothetical protein
MFKPNEEAMLGPIKVKITEVTTDGSVALYVGPYPLTGCVDTDKLTKISAENQGLTRFADEDLGPPRCPGCDRVMSQREAAEQGACNDCNGGAWLPE